MSEGSVSPEAAKPGTTPRDSDTAKILKDLMLGLIYPAVLGTIMYSGMDAAYAQATLVLSAPCKGFLPPDVDMLLKLFLLAVTLAFYVCDYLYIMFTRQYRGLFFVFDLVFLIGLYVTVRALDLPSQGLRVTPWHGFVIGVCYLAFMGLYYVWDRMDRPAKPTSDQERREQQLYDSVLKWERRSMSGLAFWLLGDAALICRLPAYTWLWLLGLLGILAWITRDFARYTWQKREFCNMYGSAASPKGTGRNGE